MMEQFEAEEVNKYDFGFGVFAEVWDTDTGREAKIINSELMAVDK